MISPDSIAHILLFSGGLALRELSRLLRPTALIEWVRQLRFRRADPYEVSRIGSSQFRRYTQSLEARLAEQEIEIQWLHKMLLERRNEIRRLAEAGCPPDTESKQALKPLPVPYDPNQSSTPQPGPDTLVIHNLQRYAELVAKRQGQIPEQSLGVTLVTAPQPDAVVSKEDGKQKGLEPNRTGGESSKTVAHDLRVFAATETKYGGN